jgi:hypothetical protein
MKHFHLRAHPIILFIIIIPFLGSQTTVAQKKKPPAQPSSLLVITPEMLRPHLRFLSSDELEGRETTKRGQKVAARYLASQFERMGLQPAGDSGTYFQRFFLYQSRIGEGSEIALSGAKDTAVVRGYGKDFYFMIAGNETVSGPLCFTGYGIDDTAGFHYSDLAGMDLAGKVALCFADVPGSSSRKGPFVSPKNKWQNLGSATPSLSKLTALRAAGAKAVIIVNDFGSEGIEEQAMKRSRSFFGSALTMTPLRSKGSAVPVAIVSSAAADRLLASSGTTVATLRRRIDSTMRPCSFDVDTRVCRVFTDNRVDSFSTENVVARLEGADPVLRSEAVVFSGHYDHLGLSAAGEVYNGADDDGSGTTAVVALAEKFSTLAVKPRRSLLFLCVTGEEKGLLGSSYYVQHPSVPLANTMCDLNIDMIGRIDTAYERRNAKDYTFVIGSTRLSSELDKVLKERNDRTMKLTLDYRYEGEKDPEQFYYRSDHYNFAKNDVPVIFFFTGTHVDYHKTTDDFEKIDFGNMSKVASLIYHIGSELANRPRRLVIDHKYGM